MLSDGSACPICSRGTPADVIAEYTATWVTAARECPLLGYACVVSKRHVVEPYELPPPERAAFWEEGMAAARVLAEMFHAVKMNYEIHGNVIPHLHLHLYPRAVDDLYDTGSLGPPRGAVTRSNELLAKMAAALRDAV